MMLSGLTSNGGRALGDGPGDHGRAGAAYLTGVHPEEDLRQGHPDRRLDGSGRGAEAGRRRRDSPRSSSAAKRACRAATATTAIAAPTATAFPGARRARRSRPKSGRAPSSSACSAASTRSAIRSAARARRLYQKSILDVVLEDAQSLQSSLGGADRRKLDEYLYGDPRHRDAHPEDRSRNNARRRSARQPRRRPACRPTSPSTPASCSTC